MAAASTLLAPDGITVPDAPVQSDYGPKNEQLPDQIKDAIISAVKKAQQEEQYPRRMEVLADSKGRFYERGQQHIYADRNNCYAVAVPGGSFEDADGVEQDWGEYIDDYPLIRGFLEIIQSVLTQNGPGIAFQAKNPARSEDTQASETAAGIKLNFDRINDVKKTMREITRYFCLSGRAATWTKTEANAMRWGRDDAGNPQKNQIVETGGCLETKIPLYEKEMSNFPYFIWYRDVDVRNARQDHPHIRKRINGGECGLAESPYERYARLGVLGGAKQRQWAASVAHITTEVHAWLRPSAFSDEEFDAPFEMAGPTDLVDGHAPSVRDMIAKIYTDQQGGFTGLHVVALGQTYSQSWPESMDDCLQVETPFVGDGQSGVAIMEGAFVAQDLFNDLMNYIAETFGFGAPSTWVYASDVDFEALQDQKARPFEFRQFKRLGENTNSVAGNVYREPNPEVPGSLKDTIQFLMSEFLQFVLGCPPAVWGESSSDTKTASALAQSRAQAQGRLGIISAAIIKMMARIYYQAALAAANDPDTPEEIIVPVKGGPNVTVRVERLRKGHFMATPDEDSGFPDSTAAKRSMMREILGFLAQFPMAADQFFSVPSNIKEICRTFGVSEFTFPEAESYDKQTLEIEMLLNSVPIGPTPEEVAAAQQQYDVESIAMAAADPMAARPPFDPASLTRSSVPINPWDHDEYEYTCCIDYLNSKAARMELEVGRVNPAGQLVPNPRGIENIWLHAMEHKQADLQKNPPMPMPAVEPKGKPKAGKPAKPEGAPPMAANGPAGSAGTATM